MYTVCLLKHFKRDCVESIAVGQWLVSGLQQPSSARQSLAARQKELSEEHRMTLKRQKCIENKQNLCNFPFFSHFFLSFFYFSFFFLHFFLFFFAFFSIYIFTHPKCFPLGKRGSSLSVQHLHNLHHRTTSPYPRTTQGFDYLAVLDVFSPSPLHLHFFKQ